MITAERKWSKSEEDTLFSKKLAFKSFFQDLKAANYLALGQWEAPHLNHHPPLFLKSPQAARPSARLQLRERCRPSGKSAVDNQ